MHHRSLSDHHTSNLSLYNHHCYRALGRLCTTFQNSHARLTHRYSHPRHHRPIQCWYNARSYTWIKRKKIKQKKRTRCITWQRNNIKWAQQRCVEYFRLTVTWTQCLNKYAWDICLHQLRRCSHFHHHISNHREYSVYCGTGTSQPRTGVLNNTQYNTKT